MTDPRIQQYKVAAEETSLTGPKRQKEIGSLCTYLHKHQDDDYTGPSRQALSHAIERHRTLSPAGCESVQLLLECALKMPEKIFGKSEKMRFLKWLDATPGSGGSVDSGGGSDSAKLAGCELTRFILLDVADDNTLTLAYANGEIYEEKVIKVTNKAALTAALEGGGEVGVWVNADGEVVKHDVVEDVA